MSTKIELSDEQEEKIALAWIEKQKYKSQGYKLVLKTLLQNAHMASWPWTDALSFAAKLCCKEYCVYVQFIRDNLEK